MAHDDVLGVSARFGEPDAIVAAAKLARAAGYRRLDAFTPFPIPELSRLLAAPDPAIPWATFLAGAAGAALGLWLGWYINVVDYPLNIGGRPPASWPAFVLPAFELAVLLGTFGAMGAMLVRNGLPRLHHPIFSAPGFERASDDGFFLLIRPAGDDFSPEQAQQFLAESGGRDIAVVGQRWAA